MYSTGEISPDAMQKPAGNKGRHTEGQHIETLGSTWERDWVVGLQILTLSLYPFSAPSSDHPVCQFSLSSILLIISNAALPHMDTSHSLLHLLCSFPSPLLHITKVCSASPCNPFLVVDIPPVTPCFLSFLSLCLCSVATYISCLQQIAFRQNEDSPFPALLSV